MTIGRWSKYVAIWRFAKWVKMAAWTPRVGRGRQEGRGCSSENFDPLRSPKRYQDPVLWMWLTVVLPYKRYQFLHNTSSPVIFFRLSTLKGTVKTAEAEHPECCLNLINAQKVRRAPPSFLYGNLPPYGQLISNWRMLSTKPPFYWTWLRNVIHIVSLYFCLVSVLSIYFGWVTNWHVTLNLS